jgi:hypothetical protein
MTSRMPPPVTARPPGRSPVRLLVTFVVALGVVLLVVGAVALALAPKPPPADCPDPTQVCSGPPAPPTLPAASQVAGEPPATRDPAPLVTPSSPPTTTPPTTAPTNPPASQTAAATAPASAAPVTPAPSVPPPATPVAPSASVPPGSPEPTPAPTAPPASAPPPTDAPATPPPATPEPTAPTDFVVPAPRAASDAAPFRAGSVWRSEQWGFNFEWDEDIWRIREEGPEFVFMVAGGGRVALTVGAYDATVTSPQVAFATERTRLEGQFLGLIEEPDPRMQLPGLPNIGYRVGLGGVFAGTANSAQGPTVNVSVALLAAGDSRITILVILVTTNDLRAPAFSLVDSMLNTLRWSEAE